MSAGGHLHLSISNTTMSGADGAVNPRDLEENAVVTIEVVKLKHWAIQDSQTMFM